MDQKQQESSVVIVQIEHPVADFTRWKAAFDSDPIDRKASGVRRYRILRPIDNPNYVAVDLEFDDRPRAEAFRGALENLWLTPQAIGSMGDGATPRARVVEESGTVEL
jgi:hypothetical protein